MSYYPDFRGRTDVLDSGAEHSNQRPQRPWSAKMRDALRGMKVGIRGHSSFFVHFFFSALVLAAAVVLRCELEQWCLLLLCIGLVLTAELFNSALETMFRGLDERVREKCYRCLDVSAGAVLMASAFACVVGAVIFIKQLLVILE